MKDFINHITNWKSDLLYGGIGAGVSVVAQDWVKEVVHLWWVLVAAFLSPIIAYFGG